jgi:small multidrug resistance family-3 protein
MKYFVIYLSAAIAEISGCFAFWLWLKLGKSSLWGAVGVFALIIFAFLLTRIDSLFAGRAFASYGSIYIFASLVWMWVVEGGQPDRWDVTGAVICLLGAAVILFGSRSL